MLVGNLSKDFDRFPLPVYLYRKITCQNAHLKFLLNLLPRKENKIFYYHELKIIFQIKWLKWNLKRYEKTFFIINDIISSTKHVVVHCILSWCKLLLIWSSILRIISHIIHLHIINRSGSRKCVGGAALCGCRGLNPKFLTKKIIESLVTHTLLQFWKRRNVSIFFFHSRILNFYEIHFEIILRFEPQTLRFDVIWNLRSIFIK